MRKNPPTPKRAREAFGDMRWLAKWQAQDEGEDCADPVGGNLRDALDAFDTTYSDIFTDGPKKDEPKA